MRHPNVLAFKDTLEVEEKGITSLYVITEPVEPLTEVLQQLDIQGQARQVASPVFDLYTLLEHTLRSFQALTIWCGRVDCAAAEKNTLQWDFSMSQRL